jgi:hypothetical protein
MISAARIGGVAGAVEEPGHGGAGQPGEVLDAEVEARR